MSNNETSAEMAENNAVTNRILYRGECPKLTTRGKGTLAYEFGVNDANGQVFLRIAANSQGGTCSFEWIPLKTVEDPLANSFPV